MTPEENGMQLRDYLAVLRRRRWVVVVAAVLVTGTAVLMSLVQTPVYQAQTRVLVRPAVSLFDTNFGSSQNLVDTEIQVMRSQPVQEAAAKKLGGANPAVSVVPVGQTSVIEVQAESTRPSQAATVSNAYAQAYIEYSRQQLVDGLVAASKDIQTQIDTIQKQVDQLTDKLSSIPLCVGNTPPPSCGERDPVQQDRDAAVSQLVPLKQRLNQLQVDSSFTQGGPSLITPAAVPTTPVRPTPKRNAALGLGVGVLFGVALAFVFEHFDDSIKSKEDLERSAPDLPVLGVIPNVVGWRNRDEPRVVSRTEPSSPTAEAYRTLRTSLHFLGVDHPMRTIQITSPNASEGKTTAVANLAVALARAGERVVIVSCDLRRPRIHEFFGIPNTTGFTSVLLGEAPLSAVLVQVPDEERLFLLPAGPLPPNPSELLVSARASELMVALRARADIVLLDCPPVLPVTDAAVLSSRADGVLVVASVGTTSRKHVVRAIELLRQVGAPLIGTILNGVSAEGGYGYAYDYYTRDERTNGRGPKRDRQPAKH